MNEDMSQYLGVFLDETSEQIEILERDILRLEHEASQKLLQEIFRAAHTLKGASRAMGFSAMGELTHAMEDIFDKLRNSALGVSSALIDALFAGLDALKQMQEDIAAGGTTELDTTAQTAQLRAVLGGPSADDAPIPVPVSDRPPSAPAPAASENLENSTAFQTVLLPTQQNALEDALASGYEVFGLKVTVAADCVMKSVRALMALQALEHIGAILATTPDDEALDNEEFENSFEIVFATQNGAEAARTAVGSIAEIIRVDMAPWPVALSDAALPIEIAPPSAESEPVNSPAESKPVNSSAAEAALNETVVSAAPAAPAASAASEKSEKKASPANVPTVRVDVARLDKLLNLVGELVIDRTRIAQLSSQFHQAVVVHELVDNLNETSTHIGRITDELQEEIMRARMLPVDNVFNRFPRMIRDLAQKLEKEIVFEIEGKETELDRSVIEVIGDPLIHMLRNSVDHGIELPEERRQAGKNPTGTVWLRARHAENHIIIEIEDDGKGMDPDKLRANAVKKGLMTQEAAARLTDKEAIHLIFASGFSTAQIVSDVSGRGVGMDIVRSNLEKLGAMVDIESHVGKGSRFTVKLPLTLAIIRGLLVTAETNVYALPLASVVETLKIQRSEIHSVNHREVLVQRGRTLPLVRMRDVFPLHSEEVALTAALPKKKRRRAAKAGAEEIVPPQEIALTLAPDVTDDVAAIRALRQQESLYVVIIGLGDKQVGLTVDRLLGEQEVVIKTLGKFVGDIQGLSGATILGDGRVALIVDINGLINYAVESKYSVAASHEKEMANAA